MSDESFQKIFTPGRVCPMPMLWGRVWSELPDRRRRGGGWEPAAPLILAAWHETSNNQKRNRLIEHLRWAESHGVLNEVLTMLESASPDEWLTEE